MTRAIVAALICAGVWLGFAAPPVFAAEDVYDQRTIQIGRQLSCPVCQGQTVADSNSRVALEMMDAIQAQVEAGRSDSEIFDYFRARYGDEVLVEPPREGINLALWWIPVIALVLGFGVVALYMKDSAAFSRRRRASGAEADKTDAELEGLAERILNEPDHGTRMRQGDA